MLYENTATNKTVYFSNLVIIKSYEVYQSIAQILSYIISIQIENKENCGFHKFCQRI